MKKITRQEVVDALLALPQDRKNIECVYRLDDEPHCVVAHALIALDLPLPDYSDNLAPIGGLGRVYKEYLNPRALNLLSQVQQEADRVDDEGHMCNTWGQAIKVGMAKAV